MTPTPPDARVMTPTPPDSANKCMKRSVDSNHPYYFPLYIRKYPQVTQTTNCVKMKADVDTQITNTSFPYSMETPRTAPMHESTPYKFYICNGDSTTPLHKSLKVSLMQWRLHYNIAQIFKSLLMHWRLHYNIAQIFKSLPYAMETPLHQCTHFLKFSLCIGESTTPTHKFF